MEGCALEVLVGDQRRIAVDDQLGVLQADKGHEQADAHADGALQGHGNGVEDALAHVGQGQCDEDDALNKDCHQRQLPAVAHGQHDRVGKVGVQAHAGSQCKGVVGQHSHQCGGNEGCHRHKRCHTCHDLGLYIGVVFFQVKELF